MERCHLFVSAITALVLTASYVGTAQELRTEYGVTGAAGLNLHSASFSKLGTFPSCCPEFTGGSGFGFAVGGYAAFPLTSSLRLHTRLTYASEGAEQTYDEGSFVADLRDSAKVVPAVFRHTLDASLSSIGLEPLLGWRLGALELMGGLRVGFVMSSTFDQREELVEPSDYGAYLGDDRVWVETNADIPEASSIRLALVGGVRYELPLNARSTMVLAPELFYHHALTGVASNVTWNAHQFRFGLALGFRPEPEQQVAPPPDTVRAPDVPVRPLLTAAIRAEGIEADGRTSPDLTIRIDETIATDLRPLLNHVYFDKGASTIPARYRALRADETTTFREEQLYSSTTMQTYHHVMDIVAQRMTQRPNARLRLTGCLAEDDGTTDLALARRRAEAVRDYLVQTWNIEADRIDIDTRATPERPTRANDPVQLPLAHAENRRVEILATDAAVMAPVATTDTIRTATPPTVRFHPDVVADAGVSSWKIEASQDGRPLFRRDGTGTKPSDVDWVVAGDRATTPRTESPIVYRLTVEDASGRAAQTLPQEIPVRQITVRQKRVERIEDREVDRFSLILFDFNDAAIKGQNAAIVDLIKRRITPQSTVSITGFTDNIGTDTYNRELARQRAERTAAALQLPASVIRPAADRAPFPLDLPEGRAYARTVTVVVETQVR